MSDLDSVDHKILYHLFLNSRQSLSSISKKTNLNKSVVEYRLKKMINNRSIENFNAVLDVYKLGYSLYRWYIRFQYTSPVVEHEILSYFLEHKNIWNIAILKGNYDIMITILIDNMDEYIQFYEETLKRFRYYFKNMYISQLYTTYEYDKPFIKNNEQRCSEKTPYQLMSTQNPVILSDVEYRILSILSKNARIPTIEIAKQVDVTSPTVLNKMKYFTKSGVIIKYSININANKLGYKIFIVNFSLRNYEHRDKIIQRLSHISFIREIYKSIGGPDIELTLFSTNFEHFYSLLEKIRYEYTDDFANHDYLYVEKMYAKNYLP